MFVAGFKVLMASKTVKAIGGYYLNGGCVPSKAISMSLERSITHVKHHSKL
jgi:pyruvate/2-oxoglutarate dehydrogenase complex dihydrolipoamide dehydrogenase (E3) component